MLVDANTESRMPQEENGRFAIETRQLRFSYEHHQVLTGVDLQVEPGTFCCLMGPNGSGKSTLIQLLSKVLYPLDGSIDVFGKNLGQWDHKQLARTIAVVPQHFQVAFPFTVEQIVMLGRVPHRGPWALDTKDDLEIVHQAMRDTGVGHLAGRRISELSGGELKRVVVAKALAQQPRLLLLDEPAAHLDIKHQVDLYSLVDRIRKNTGLTVLAAVHDLNLSSAFGEKFCLLKNGKLAASGTLESVMTYGHLSEVFGIDIYVGVNEITGHRLFTPMVLGRKVQAE